jgi:NADPH-dependent 2,4-dienoyl-CoA reductase/sulfur reductase-like enzyme
VTEITGLHDAAVKMKTVVIGAGPVGALAAIYAAQRGHEVEVYELRNGELYPLLLSVRISLQDFVQYMWIVSFCLVF